MLIIELDLLDVVDLVLVEIGVIQSLFQSFVFCKGSAGNLFHHVTVKSHGYLSVTHDKLIRGQKKYAHC